MIQQPAGGSFNVRGAWSGTAGYNPFDVVTHSGVPCLCYAEVAAPGGSPVVDPSGPFHVLSAVNLPTTVLNGVAMTNAGELCVVMWNQGMNTSSIADTASNTYTMRWRKTASDLVVELWTTPIAAGFSGLDITATLASHDGNDTSNMIAFGINNEAGFDPNGGLPFTTTGTSAMSVSTTDSPDLGLYLSSNSQSQGQPATPAGMTTLVSLANGNGLNVTYMTIATEAFASPLSGHAINPSGGGAANINIFDAITNTGASNPAPASDPSHWIVGA